MSLKELQNILQAGTIPGLILLHGQEPYFVERGMLAVRDAVVAPENRDFNLTQFYGKDFIVNDVVEQARTYPVFADRRLVMLKNIHESRVEQLEGLLDYVLDPVPETVLLLTAEKIDARRKIFQLFKKNGVSIEFIETVANRIVEFTPNGVIDRYMSFEEYINHPDVRALRAELYAGSDARLVLTQFQA